MLARRPKPLGWIPLGRPCTPFLGSAAVAFLPSRPFGFTPLRSVPLGSALAPLIPVPFGRTFAPLISVPFGSAFLTSVPFGRSERLPGSAPVLATAGLLPLLKVFGS